MFSAASPSGIRCSSNRSSPVIPYSPICNPNVSTPEDKQITRFSPENKDLNIYKMNQDYKEDIFRMDKLTLKSSCNVTPDNYRKYRIYRKKLATVMR
jgi:hypothetical protein